ncbi:MAG: hypothetical protein KAY37_08700, partial [Phycisphaerae bacterium]|nr:hypothetical protein [Phycisphaerae bacterium]
ADRAAVAETPSAARPLLSTTPPESTLDFKPEPYLFESRRLRELILANLPDPRDPTQGVAPLQALASLDSHRHGYRDQLRQLTHDYRDTLLYPNLVVRWAAAHVDREERARMLRACVARFPDDDAFPEALFQLADLEVQTLGSGNEASRAAGIERLRALVARFGQTCWGKLAAQRLGLFDPQATTNPTVSP